MKFKFPFNTLIKEREARKDEAEREFRIAQSKSDEQKAKLQSYRQSLSIAKQEIQNVRSNGGKLVSTLTSLEEYIEGQKIRISNQVRVVKGLDEILDQKRMILVEANRELKILEKLKEKRFEEFKKAMKKREMKIIDEIATMRAFRRAE